VLSCTAPTAGLSHAVNCDLDLDLLTPKIEAFILVPKYINAESLVKFSPVILKILHEQGQKVHFPACWTNRDLEL